MTFALKIQAPVPAWSGLSCQPKFLPLFSHLAGSTPGSFHLFDHTLPYLRAFEQSQVLFLSPLLVFAWLTPFHSSGLHLDVYLTSYHSIFIGPPFIWYLRVWLVFLTVLLSPGPYLPASLPTFVVVNVTFGLSFLMECKLQQTERWFFFTVVSLVPRKVAGYVIGAQRTFIEWINGNIICLEHSQEPGHQKKSNRKT